MKKTFYIILSFLLVFSTGSFGQFKFLPDPFSEKKSAAAMQAEAGAAATSYTTAVQIDKWNEMYYFKPTGWTDDYQFKSLQDVVRVGVNRSILTVVPAYKYKVALSIKCYTLPPFVTYTTRTEVLYLSYHPDSLRQYTDMSVFKFSGCARFEVTITGIYPESSTPGTYSPTPLPMSDVARNFFIEAEIQAQRYDKPKMHLNTNCAYQSDTRSLRVYGNLKTTSGGGAGEPYSEPNYKPAVYELEWMYIDDYQYNISTATKSYKYPGTTSLAYDFRKNSTRVQVESPVYQIPLIYEHGVILYRFRMLRPVLNNYDQLEYGDWTMTDNGTISTTAASFPQYGYILGTAHTADALNWQHTINFAEQGKYKNVVNYFDGSLKDRQTQTKINTDKDYIVAVEKVYDYEGRPSVVSLPTPVAQKSLEYHNGVLRNSVTGTPYKAADFDFLGCSRPGAIDPLHASAAAHIYYSPLNADKSGLQKFVPDAEGYPMVQTVYSPDNTNKVSWQGGAGKEQQLSKGHGTQYEYVRANQFEVDRLMGPEVGYHRYYPKQIVTDPNGQSSYSVLNPQGKVIISALQGAAPATGDYPIEPLPNFVAGDLVCNDLLRNEEQEQLPNGLAAATSVYNDGAGGNRLTYSLKTFPYYTGCSNQYLWTAAQYNITVTDDCGVPYSQLSTSGTLDPIMYTTSGPGTPGYRYVKTVPVTPDPNIPKGKVLVDKKVTFSEYDIRNQVRGFIKNNEPLCYKSENYFVRQSVENTEMPCKKEFEDPEEDDNDCDKLRREMIKQMYPGAKYGQFVKNDNGSFKDEMPNSIFTIVDKEPVLPPGGDGFMDIEGTADQCTISGCGTIATGCESGEGRCGCPTKAHSYKDACCNACLLGHCKCITFPTAYETVSSPSKVTKTRVIGNCRFDNKPWSAIEPMHTEWATSYILGVKVNVFERMWFDYQKVCCAHYVHTVPGQKTLKGLVGIFTVAVAYYEERLGLGTELLKGNYFNFSPDYGDTHSCTENYEESVLTVKDVPMINVGGKPFANDPKYRYQSDCGITFPAEKWHKGKLYRDLANLDPQTLIEIFDDEIAEALLPLHPEYCRLLACEASSGTFERKFDALETYQQAEAAGMYNLDDIIDQDPLPAMMAVGEPSMIDKFKNAMKVQFRMDRADEGLTTLPADAPRLDKTAATQVYCAGGNNDEMTVCAADRYASEIATLTFYTGEMKQRYFESLKALYQGNRGIMKQYSLAKIYGKADCAPCDKYRMMQVGDPVFPQLFVGSYKGDGTFEDGFLDELPEWKRTMYMAAMKGISTDFPPEILSEYNSYKDQIAEAEAEAVMAALKDCPFMGDLATLKNLFKDKILEGNRLTPAIVQDIIVAFTGSTAALNDLCNTFLVSYGRYPDDKSIAAQKSNFACGNPDLLSGLQQFLNRPEIKNVIKTAPSSGSSTSATFTLNGSNAFEQEIKNAVGSYFSFYVDASLRKAEPSCSSSCRERVRLVLKGRSDLYIEIQALISEPGHHIRAFTDDISPYTLNFQNAKCLNEEPAAMSYGLVAQRTAVIEANCDVCTVSANNKYYIWNSFTDLMISLPDAATMQDAVTCIDVRRELENFKTDQASYGYSTSFNHPHTPKVLANYLNYKFGKKYNYPEYFSLMNGCALSDVVAVPRELANVKIEFSSEAQANTFENTTLPAVGAFRPAVFRFKEGSGGASTAFIDLNPVLSAELKAYLTAMPASSGGGADPHITHHYNTANNDNILFTQTTCSFSASNLPSGAIYTSGSAQVWENGAYQPYTKHTFRLPGATAKQNADMLASVRAYLDGLASGENCKGYYAFFSSELLRPADYNGLLKQAYLTYVYGLSPSVTANRASYLAALNPAALPASVSGFSGSTFTYDDPYIKGSRNSLYAYNPYPAGTSGTYVLKDKMLAKIIGSGSGTTPFPDADATRVGTGVLEESLLVIRKANGDYWYRFFIGDDQMYNAYIVPPAKNLGKSLNSYTINLSTIEMGPLPRTFFVTATSGSVSVKCSGYTDFELVGTNTASDVILDRSRKGQFPFDSLDCEKDLLTTAVANGKEMYRLYFEENVATISEDFMNHLIHTTKDTLIYCGRQQQYQQTLYYYDRVGNLTRTVPPEGIDPLVAATVGLPEGGYRHAVSDAEKYRNDPSAYLIDYPPTGTFPYTSTPNPKLTRHGKVSSYKYNSLNQLVWQQTPDGGITSFFYDAAGRQIFSQNSEQRTLGYYTYNLYDAQGRLEENGQIKLAHFANPVADPDNTPYLVSYRTRSSSGTDTNYSAMHPDFITNSYDEKTYPYEDLKYFIRMKGRRDVVLTAYDEATADLGAISGEMLSTQENLRNRVAAIRYYDMIGPLWSPAPDKPLFGTHYSYDLSGNVKTITYDFPRLEFDYGARYHRVDYDYDLVSGKVNMISYNRGHPDQFYQQYDYDADNRITTVNTSNDGLIWNKDARYEYYKHGPLASLKLGEQQVQSLEYAYTIQGWLKAINGDVLNATKDMGQNGLSGDATYPRDVIAHALRYFSNDYKPIGTTPVTNIPDAANKNLYNGNITQQTTGIGGLGTLQRVYSYDQLQRLKLATNGRVNDQALTASFTPANLYKSTYSYDKDGNISTLERWDGNTGTPVQIDNFAYRYEPSASFVDPPKNNKLLRVEELAGATTGTDLQPGQPADNYSYDRIGNLVRDKQGAELIRWDRFGKVVSLYDSSITTRRYTSFAYDGRGNRIFKEISVPLPGSGNTDKKGEYYVRDAGGNILAVYRTHSVYDRVLRFKILVVEGSGVLSPTDGLGTVLTDVLTASYSGTSLIEGLKGVVLTGHSGWVTTYTDKPVGFYWNADPTLRSTLLYSGNAWIDAMRASAPQVHRDALLLAGTAVQPLFFSAMDQPTEGRKLIQHYSTQMPQPVCQSIWNSVQAQYIPGNHVANASALYTKMTPQFKPMLLSQMTQQIQQNFQQAQPQAAAFYNAVMADNTVWSAPVLRANNGPWTSGITQIVNMYANDGALQSFFNTWAGGPSALAAAVTPAYRLDAVYNALPYATTRDMCLTATTDELTGVISAIPGITYYGLKNALVVAGIEEARIHDGERMASSGDTLALAEHHLYGSSRLGVQRYDSVTIANIIHLPEESTVQERNTLRNRVPWYSYDFADLVDSTKRTPWAPGLTGNAYTGIWNTNRTLGRKFFELSDHLGNVLVTVLDRKTGSGTAGGGTLYDHWSADIASAADYYPGGMMMPGRNVEHSWSRMGMQGQQKDDEIYGKGNVYAFKHRMEDARINRFFSPDPLHTKYPHNSDYAFSENRLTDGVELEGLEWSQIKKWSMEAAQTAKWMYKTVSTDIAMYAFPENISKAFLYHYAHGQGTPLYLTPSDMGKLNVYHISIVGTSPRDMEKFDKMRSGATVGEAIPLNGYTLDNAAGQAGTLGRFTMVLNGSITFTNKSKSEWTFKGTMRYEDIWDFERNAETDKGGYEGNSWSDAQTEFGKKYLSGTPYKIISYDVPVSQTSNQTVIDYFNGRSQESKSNRITDEKGELDDENR